MVKTKLRKKLDGQKWTFSFLYKVEANILEKKFVQKFV
jgi:hypothetical protein